jgi:hypothetical protein
MRLSIPAFALLSAFASTSVYAGAELPEPQIGFSYVVSDISGDRTTGPEIEFSRRFGRNTAVAASFETMHLTAPEADLAAPLTRRLDETRQLGRLDASYTDGATLYTLGVSETSGSSSTGSVVRASIAQPFWHNLSQLTVGVLRGWDQNYRLLEATDSRDSQYVGHAGRRGWWGSLEQIVTPKLQLSLDGSFLDQTGSLSQPNLGVRFLLSDGLVALGNEVVPGTRGRYSVGLHGAYALSNRDTLRAGAGYFYDSWGIRARSFDATWRRSLRTDRLQMDVHARKYGQSQATFYSDLASGIPQGDISRDRSLARHDSLLIGVGLEWHTHWQPHLGVQRWTTGFNIDATRDAYDDFRDVSGSSAAAGIEPLYRKVGFLAQLRLTGWF